MKEIDEYNSIKEHLKYERESGTFIWIGKQPGITKNTKAGTVQKIGYRRIQINNKLYSAHRLVWFFETGIVPHHEIDHIDGNKDNNVFSNLRAVTRSENCKNTKIRKTNSSGVIGVHKVKRSGKYQARISDLNGNRVVLGTFSVFEDAVDSRKKAEKIYGYHKNHGRSL